MLTQPTGVLRASLPVDFAATYLTPLIAEFAALYPGISFDFDLTPRRANMVTEPFDVAIRMGESEKSQLIARTLATLTPHLYASPLYLERSGLPSIPNDLDQHECFSILKSGKWTLRRGDRTVTVSASGQFSINNVGMARHLATLGIGIILMPEEIVAVEIFKGKLVRLLP